ncbi:MAG: PRC and DUF2382 domain-containing protein [Micromonosporaceae bacterium]
MITRDQIPNLLGHTAYDQAHHKLGRIGQVFVDDDTGVPEWLTVQAGLFGTKESFVPAQAADLRGDEVLLPFPQEQIRQAPKVETEDGHLSPAAEALLYDYYGLQYQPYAPAAEEAPVSEASVSEAEEAPVAAFGDVTEVEEVEEAPAAEEFRREAEESRRVGEMTRHEEHLRIDKVQRESGRARLRKYTTTEYEEHTVPLRKERVRVEREPISEEARMEAAVAPEVSEEEQEIVLHEERPVVSRENVPVERVRMEKESFVEDETVGGEVRQEHIESETEFTGPADEEWRG